MNGSEMISPRTKDISLSLVPLRRQDLKRTLDSIVGRAAELANTRHGYLFHLEASGAQMVMTAGVGFFERRVGDKIVPGQSIAGMAWQTGETLVENNYSTWPGRVPNPDFDRLRSLAGVPLRSGDRIIGVIGLGFLVEESGSFGPEAIDHLTQIGELASLALDNAQLFDMAQKEIDERAHMEEELLRARDELEERVAARTSELQASEEKYRSTLENIEEGVYELDLAGRFTFTNDAIASLAGYSREELNGMHYRRYVVPEDVESVKAAFAQVLATGHAQREVGYRLLTRDERVRHIEISVSLVKDALGNPRGFRGAVRDITVRRVADEAAQLQSAYLAALQETTIGLMQRLEITELLEDILQRAGSLVNTEHGYLYLLEANVNEMQMRVGTGVQTQNVGNRIKPGDGLAGQVWQRGEPFVVNDYPTWPGRLRALAPTRLRAVAGVPLTSGGKIVGVIGLSYLDEGRTFGENEIASLSRFAQLASIALDNAQLFAQRQRRVVELEMINSLSRALSAQLDIHDLVEAVGESIRQTLNMPISYVALFNAETNLIQFPYWIEGERRLQVGPFRYGEGLTSVVLRTKAPLLINKDADEVTAQLGGKHTGGPSVKSYLGVPIILGTNVIGVLSAQSIEKEGLFSSDDVRLLTTIAANVGVALENARLFHEAQAARDELEERVSDRTNALSRANEHLTQQNAFMAALHETALSLMNRLDLVELLQSIVERAARLSGTRNGYVYLLSPGGSDMMMQVGTGIFERRVGERIRRNQGIAGAAWQSGTTLALDDYLNWPPRAPDPLFDQLRVHIAVPLISGDRVVGILGLGQAERVGPLTEKQTTDRVHQFAEMATIALDSARLFEEAQKELAERKRVEHQLEVARDQAVEASRLKSEFLANMSHEIRTPMNAVVGMTGLLTSSKLDGRQKYFVDTIRSSSDALLTIIDDILDLSKMEAGKLTLENMEFRPLASVEEAADLLAPRAREKNLSLMTFVSPEIPMVLRGDPVRLQQILLNLTGNALKFTDRGQVVVAASLENETQSQVVVRFAVSDTGIGLSPEAHERIFEPFTQADGSTTRKFGGTGLGLSISRRLVELMNGEIHVVSEQDKGSTFWFTAQFEKTVLPPEQGFALARGLADARVLVVDESQSSREFLHRYLSAWGMRDSMTSNAQDALKMLRRAALAHEPYDAMIVDLSLSGSDAFALAKQVRQEPALARTKLVMLTAFDEEGLGQRAIDSGFTAYLVKPVKQSQLFDTIAEVMGEGPGPRRDTTQQPAPNGKAASKFLDGRTAEDALILIAEDHPVNKEVAILQLEQLGLRSHAVTNGQEAVEAIDRTPFTLVLMDCQMPEMDGYEATRLIRNREAGTGRHLPIIAMTAHAMQGDREVCLAAGMDDYLSKPVTLDKLRAVLQYWIPRMKAQLTMQSTTTAATSMHTEGSPQRPVDLTVIAELKAMQGDDHGFMSRLIKTYFVQTDQLLENMRTAAMGGDPEGLRLSAHKLKGGSAVLGVKTLAGMCYDLELQARTGVLYGAVDKVALAMEEYVSVQAVLRRELPGEGE